MNTNYYKLKKPISRLDVDEITISMIVWINGERAGKLFMYHGEMLELLKVLHEDISAAYTNYGGGGIGMQLGVYFDMHDSTQLISEYGQLTTLEEIKKNVKISQEEEECR